MTDYGHKIADSELKRLEKELKHEYNIALQQLKQEAHSYFDRFMEKDKAMVRRMKAGEISHKDYIVWRKNQMIMNEHYNTMIRNMSHNLTHTNQIAMSMIDKTLPKAYAENYNYAGYEVCHGLNLNLSFELVDTNTVERLLKAHPELLPRPRVEIPKDLKWNARKLNSALIQGILLGDSIPHIADRLQTVTDMSRNAAIRNARTMTTGAESAGRMARYREVQRMGVDLKKTWLATLDGRTRDWHIELDQESVPIDEPFVNEYGEIDYPGDTGADPANVYNCRCTLVADTKNMHVDYSVRQMSPKLGDVSYDEWKGSAKMRAKSRSDKHGK